MDTCMTNGAARRHFLASVSAIVVIVATGTFLLGGWPRCVLAASPTEATAEQFALELERSLRSENPRDYHKWLSESAVHVAKRNPESRAKAGELALPERRWKLVWNRRSSRPPPLHVPSRGRLQLLAPYHPHLAVHQATGLRCIFRPLPTHRVAVAVIHPIDSGIWHFNCHAAIGQANDGKLLVLGQANQQTCNPGLGTDRESHNQILGNASSYRWLDCCPDCVAE